MTENQILQILECSVILFDSDENLNKFQQAIINKEYQKARYILDVEMDYNVNINELSDIKYNTYSTTEDLLMDLIINEIDGARESNKQFNKNTR